MRNKERNRELSRERPGPHKSAKARDLIPHSSDRVAIVLDERCHVFLPSPWKNVPRTAARNSIRASTDLAIVYEAYPRGDEPRAINSDNGSDTGYFCVSSSGTMGRIFNRRWRRPVFIFERPGGRPLPTPVFPSTSSPARRGSKKLLCPTPWYFAAVRSSRGQFAARSGSFSSASRRLVN